MRVCLLIATLFVVIVFGLASGLRPHLRGLRQLRPDLDRIHPLLSLDPSTLCCTSRCVREPAHAEALSSQLSWHYHVQFLVSRVGVRGRTFCAVRILVETKVEAETLAAMLLSNQEFKAIVTPLP